MKHLLEKRRELRQEVRENRAERQDARRDSAGEAGRPHHEPKAHKIAETRRYEKAVDGVLGDGSIDAGDMKKLARLEEVFGTLDPKQQEKVLEYLKQQGYDKLATRLSSEV
jgi:hypothetical protein